MFHKSCWKLSLNGNFTTFISEETYRFHITTLKDLNYQKHYTLECLILQVTTTDVDTFCTVNGEQ